MPGQPWLQLVELARQHGLDHLGRDRLLAADPETLLERERQVPLDLQRGAQLGRQQLDGFVRDQLARRRVLGGAGPEQPSGVLERPARDAVEGEAARGRLSSTFRVSGTRHAPPAVSCR